MPDSYQEKDNASGKQIGTTATQLIGFRGATPVAQPASASQAVVAATSSAVAAFTDPPSAAEMSALRTAVNAIRTDVAALIVLANRLRLDLVNQGLIKGAA